MDAGVRDPHRRRLRTVAFFRTVNIPAGSFLAAFTTGSLSRTCLVVLAAIFVLFAYLLKTREVTEYPFGFEGSRYVPLSPIGVCSPGSFCPALLAGYSSGIEMRNRGEWLFPHLLPGNLRFPKKKPWPLLKDNEAILLTRFSILPI